MGQTNLVISTVPGQTARVLVWDTGAGLVPYHALTLFDGTPIDGTHPLPITGSFNLATTGVYNQTPPALSDGQNAPLQLDATGNLKIAGTFSANIGATYNQTPPTLTSGQTGNLQADSAGNLKVAVQGNTAITAAALPLPAGASTEATLAALNAKIPASGQKAMSASLPVVLASDQPGVPVTGTFWQATQPVSLASVPSHAVTNAGTFPVQSAQAGNWTVTANMGTTNGLALDATLSTLSGKLPTTLGQKAMAASLGVTIASDQTPIPVSGTFSANAVTQGTYLVTPPTLSDTQTTPLLVDAQGNLKVAGTFSASLSTTYNQAPPSLTNGQTAPLQGDASGNLKVAVQGTVQVSNTSLPLPTGAATEATLAAQSAKLPASLGQKASSASMSVVVASDQPTIPVSLASVPSHQVSNNGTFPVQASITGTVPVSGTFWQATQPVSMTALPALAAGTNVIGKVSIDQTTPGTTNLVAANQNGVWTVTANLGTLNGAALDTTVAAMSGKLPATLGQKASTASMSVVLASDQANVPVSGVFNSTPPTLTNGTKAQLQLDASGNLKVAGTFNANTQGTYNQTLPTLTTGQQGSLQLDVNGRLLTMAGQSGAWNINNISGAISLPTGAATSANQSTQNTTLANILTQITTVANDLNTQNTNYANDDVVMLHSAATRKVVSTGSQVIITPPANCKEVWISANNEILVRTDNVAATDADGVARVLDSIVPCTPLTGITACAVGADAIVYITPLVPRGA